MEEIQRKVAHASRRLVLQQFLAIAPWCLFATLMVAAAGLALPKLWFLELDPQVWTWAWIGGGLGAGLLIAAIWTYVSRRGPLDAAIEIDRRFALKERVSSALSLSAEERNSSVGRALVEDAQRRVGVLELGDRFTVRATWRALLPLLPALIVFALVTFVPNADRKEASAATSTAEMRERIKKSTEDLRKQLAQRRKSAEQQGLKDAEDIFNKIHQGLDDLANDNDVDRQKALVKLNDLAKEIEKRKSLLGDPDKMKQQFDRLKNIEQGPAERIANALQEGEFQKALEGIKQLSEKLKAGELSAEDQKKLAEQLKQMQEKLEEMVEAHEQAKQDLERQIQQKMAEGDLEAVSQLQRKLDKLEQQDQQMERLGRMAEQLGEASQQMQSGDAKSAAAELSELGSELEELQAQLDELEMLDAAMDEIASAKDCMCDGEMADMFSSFGGSLDQFNDMPGNGLGEGRGYGYRPEEETETGEYQARERAQPKAGEAVRVGDAGGPNRAGMSQEGIKEQIISSLNNEADPLTDQRLPKSQQDHVRQYYQRLGKDE